MATATAIKRHIKSQRISLKEDFTPGQCSPLRVDREKGIIYHAKFLGWVSDNNREYLPEAVKKAISLYEGAKSFCDHPDKANATRSSHDALGIFHNVTIEGDGAYTDYHYLKSHPMAERVCEDAERGMGIFGFSHNADGKTEVRDGKTVIVEILAVRSVDLVTDPATVSNLWEGRNVAKKKVRDVFAGLTFDVVKRERMKAILEGDSLGKETLMEAYEDAEPGAALKDGFLAEIQAVFNSDMDGKAKGKKITELCKAHEKLTTEPDMEGDDDADKKDDDKPADKKDDKPDPDKKESRVQSTDPAVKQLQEQLDAIKADKARTDLKMQIRELCESKGLTWDKSLEEGMVAIGDVAKIGKHLDWLKGKVPAKRTGPRSTAPGSHVQESRTVPATAKDQAALLLR